MNVKTFFTLTSRKFPRNKKALIKTPYYEQLLTRRCTLIRMPPAAPPDLRTEVFWAEVFFVYLKKNSHKYNWDFQYEYLKFK